MSLWYLRREGEPRRKLIERETAEEAVLACGDEEAVILAGKEVWEALFTLDREPGDWETIDEETGAFVLDAAAADGALHRQIDIAAGEFRCRFITDIPGQELTYLRKEEEARRFMADGPGPFPMLESQAAAVEATIEDLAAEVVARADAWIALGALIEAKRHGAKQAVAEAEGLEAKRAAAAVDWGTLLAPDKPVKPLGGQGEGE